MFSMKSNLVPGPGTYNVPSSLGSRAAVILPLTPRELHQLELSRPQHHDDDSGNVQHPSPSAEGGSQPRSSSIPRECLPIIKQWQIPPLGTYDLPSTNAATQRIVLHGTPRSDRVVLNVDLGLRSRMPGPGQYNLSSINTMAGRDRTYRTRLPLERINVMAPIAKSPRKSPRRLSS
jgi:hypothetical protein